jgi:hypothetical protein
MVGFRGLGKMGIGHGGMHSTWIRQSRGTLSAGYRGGYEGANDSLLETHIEMAFRPRTRHQSCFFRNGRSKSTSGMIAAAVSAAARVPTVRL